MTDLTLTPAELERITGYSSKRPGLQVKELHRLGYFRARRGRVRGEVICERAHVEAVAAVKRETAERKACAGATELRLAADRLEQPARLKAALADARTALAQRKASDPEFRAHSEQMAIQRAGNVRHHASKRRAAKLQRTPPWADMEAIEAIYTEAARRTAETGVQHDVDHEIPLQGKLVSGLHVHNNLQILTASENSKKRNRYEP